MLNRILAALLLALIFTIPCEAGQSPRDFLRAQTESREPVFMGKPVSRDNPAATARAAGLDRSALSIARRYIGTNPTGMKRLWCQAFINYVEKKAGRKGTGSNLAISSLKYGKRVPLSQARPGDIVVTDRKGPGTHVSYFVADLGSRFQALSGNSSCIKRDKRGRCLARTVAIGTYAKSKVLGVVRPS